MTMGFMLDVVVAVLLVVTVVYCWRLNQRLSTLRQGRAELAALVTQLTQATMRAESSIGALKIAAKEASQGLEENIGTARSLRDELAMITETGNNLANRLETGLTGPRRGKADVSVDLDAAREERTRPARPPKRDADQAAREHILNTLRQAR
jgi:hypothetical protein